MSVQRVRWYGAGSRGARRRHARRRTQRAHAADACDRRAQRAQGTPASGQQAPMAPPAGQTAIVPDVAGPARPRKLPCRPACRPRGRHEGDMRQHDPVALSDLPPGRGRRLYCMACTTVARGNLRHEFYGGGRLAELRSCDVYFQAETDSALCREAVWGWTRPWFVLAGSGRPRPAPRAGMACSDAGRVWGVWPVWCPVPPVERGASGVLPGVAGVVPCSSRPARCRPGLRAPTGRNRLCLHHGRPRCPAAAPVPGMRCRPFPAPCSGSSL